MLFIFYILEKTKRIDKRLLDNDALTANHTIVVNPPEIMTSPDPETRYHYDRFPTIFHHKLFETELILKAKLKNDVLKTEFKNNQMDMGIYCIIFIFFFRKSEILGYTN